MKIAPTTQRWNEGECDWSFVANPCADIVAWEKREGLALPDPYRKFMLLYNGGHVYPRKFRSAAGLGRMLGPYTCQDDEMYCDRIMSWARVEAIWRGEVFGAGVPPKHIVIAETGGEIEIIMALTSENYGHIYTWVHSNSNWGSEGNKEIFPVANSFQAFLSSLYDDEDNSDYDDWCIPIYETLAKEVRLEDLQ